MIFRNAEFSDWEAVARLHASSWRSAYQGILAQEFLDNFAEDDRRVVWRDRLSDPNSETRLVRVAVGGTTIAGFVCVFLDHDERWGALLDNVHVRPDLKGRGVGRQLMAQAASWVIDRRPASSLHLWVFEDNHSARAFYERFGGTSVERSVHHAADGNGVPAICYVWEDLTKLVKELCARPPRGLLP
jgi:ribosomal protein S18 acetylase RimI-like enzyme